MYFTIHYVYPLFSFSFPCIHQMMKDYMGQKTDIHSFQTIIYYYLCIKTKKKSINENE